MVSSRYAIDIWGPKIEISKAKPSPTCTSNGSACTWASIAQSSHRWLYDCCGRGRGAVHWGLGTPVTLLVNWGGGEGGGGGWLIFSPLPTNKIHTFISWQIFHLQLSPPVAALDIKIDLAGQLTGQLVAVIHEVSQYHVTEAVPKRKHKFYLPETNIISLRNCCWFLKIPIDCCCVGGGGGGATGI
jgi:hypothetical protein